MIKNTSMQSESAPMTTRAIMPEWTTAVKNHILSSFDDIDQSLRDPVLHLPKAEGKYTRPVLFFALSEMMGGDYEEIISVGSGFEMIHVATLVGDDLPIMDDDSTRRGVDTVHVAYSDADAALASRLLHSRGDRNCLQAATTTDQYEKLSQLLDELAAELTQGQHHDMRYSNGETVVESASEEEYTRMVRGKTAQIYATIGEFAVILTDTDKLNNNQELYRRYAREFGHNAGLAHQFTDDVLDFSTENTDKDLYSDVRNKKLTVVTIHAKNNGVPIFDESIPIEDRVAQLKSVGSLEYGASLAEQHMEEAISYLDQLPVENVERYNLIHQFLQVILNQIKDIKTATIEAE